MKSELNKMVFRWHAWNDDRYFDYTVRAKIKEDLRLMIINKFSLK